MNQAGTTTAITSHTPGSSQSGQGVAVTYSVTPVAPGAGTPTGNVTVGDGVDSCTGAVAAGTCTIGLTTAGARSLSASYIGNASFSGSTTLTTTSHTVSQAGTTTAITAQTPDPSNAGQSVAVTWSVSVVAPGSGTPAGNVTVSDGVDSCSDAVAAGGCSVVLTTAGNRTLTAQYVGNSNIAGSTSSGVAHHVMGVPAVSVSGQAPSPSNVGQAVTLTATVSGSGDTPTGTVQFKDNGVNIGSAASLSETVLGTATASISPSYKFTVAGTHPVTAVYTPLAVYVGATSASVDHQVNGTPATAGQLIISEFRLSGPSGLWDEFVEIYNTTLSAHTVGTNDGSAGYALVAADGVTRFVIPNGTVIRTNGYFLGANSSGYSLGGYAAGAGLAVPDAMWDNATDIAEDTGLALFNTANPANFGAGTRLDAAGFSTLPGGSLYREGATGLTPIGATTAEHSWLRYEGSGVPVDTNNNASDFVLISTTTGAIGVKTPVLGGPSPENLSSPVSLKAAFTATLLDLAVGETVAPNRVRTIFAGSPPQTFGTMEFRRKIRNFTGAPVTRLRFRVVNITTTGSAPVYAPPQCQLRVLSSADLPAVGTSGGFVLVKGTTLEEPPAQAAGGGLGSSVTVSLGTPLANGAAVNVNFLLGVEVKGSFNFYVVWEALP